MGYMGTHIPPDDLHWNKTENKFVLLTDAALDAIITSCKKGYNGNTEECIRAVRWAEQVQADYLTLQGVIQGRLSVYVDPVDATNCYIQTLNEESSNEFRDND